MGISVNTVEVRIQNAILTAIDNIITPRVELAIRSMNASPERGFPNVGNVRGFLPLSKRYSKGTTHFLN